MSATLTAGSEADGQAHASDARPLSVSPDRFVDWPAILAGGIAAAAIASVFTGFGGALGLSLVSPYASWNFGSTAALVAIGLWMLFTAISSSMVGGYLAGRMRRPVDGVTRDERHIRDGVHGLVVWSIGVLIGVMLLGSAASTTARVGGAAADATAQTASSIVGGAAEAVGSTAGGIGDMLPDELQANPLDYAADMIFRGGAQERAAANESAGDGVPAEQPAAPASEQRLRDEARTILASIVTTGEISDEDRAYLEQLAAQRTGLSEEEVEAQVARAVETIQSAREQARETAEAAQAAAREAAETARRYAIVAAFLIAASLLVAAAAAYWSAGVGGRHRDEGRVLSGFGHWN